MSITRMYRVLVAVAFAVVGVCAVPGVAQEADHWENLIIPQHRVVLPPIRESSVRIESVDVAVSIAEQVATTTVAIVLRNPSGRQQESQLLMPVPDGAVVRQFRLEGLPNEGIARVLTREEARRIYESIVRRTRDPGLIEFVGLNLIKSSVFPVPANGTQKMELVYEQVLTADGSRVEYVLPRSESLERSGVKWSMRATISSSRVIGTVYSPSHDLATERLADGSVRVTVPASSANDPGAFRLSYVMAAADGFSASLIAYPDPRVGTSGNGGYFMLLLGVPTEVGRPVMKREITIVLDRSGSMRGLKLEQAKNAALQILGALDEGEYFNIVDYSDTIESFSSVAVEKTDESLKQAERYINGLAAVGGTNIHDALVLALSAAPAEGTLPLVLFLTDGLATVGVQGERDIREAARKANTHSRRIFSFGVGFDVNSPLLSALATNSRGVPTFVMPDEDIEVKVGQVFKRLRGPVLAMPKLEFLPAKNGIRPMTAPPIAREIMPGSLNDIFEGEQVVVLGQYLDTDDKFGFHVGEGKETMLVHLTGTRADGREAAFNATFDLTKASVKHSYVPRIWAMRKIGTLIDEIRQSGADGGEPSKELVDEVIRLSTEFGILTEYTAFLAAEENEFLGQFVDRPAMDAPASVVEDFARLELRSRISERSGGRGISQEANSRSQREAGKLNAYNSMRFSAPSGGRGAGGVQTMEETRFVSVRQNADQTMYRRGDRWVDAQLLDQVDAEPERVIEFASDEYFELAEQLARDGRQSVLAVTGDIYLLFEGQRVLIRQGEP
ncbi:hypothetical protein MNBD_PLANCTO03-2450 [hydrothermal vent metagenome]|uniref:VWA domain-containing protein n=1 Tax=hydrothermal vent metagenome TaxID=652676 RepID=A0A3B1DSV4_9ZZZZ